MKDTTPEKVTKKRYTHLACRLYLEVSTRLFSYRPVGLLSRSSVDYQPDHTIDLVYIDREILRNYAASETS